MKRLLRARSVLNCFVCTCLWAFCVPACVFPPGRATTSDLDLQAPPSRNPFLNADGFIDPAYAARVLASASRAATADANRLRTVARMPTAVWLDSIEKVSAVASTLALARQQQAASKTAVVVTFVVYDLPNRDCAAKASAGELTLENAGEARYRAEFIDPIAAELGRHPDQRVVLVIEPDSLANLATNLNITKCRNSAAAYRGGVAYAVSKLSLPNVSIYLDAAHAGWLGWPGNRAGIVKVFKQVLTEAGGYGKIRGYATNVANFNVTTGTANLRLEPSNPCPDELTYVSELAASLRWAGLPAAGFLIDTSRNGRDGIRTRWGSWCNVKGAGLGPRPRSAPAPLVDAYVWIKPPGESDGTSDQRAARFDSMCGSNDAAPGAPEAGKWFEPYFLDLVKNADPPL